MPQNLSPYTDEELIALYRQTGNTAVLGQLYIRHSLMCFAVCNKYLRHEEASQDAVMHIFESLFVMLRKHEVQHFRSWLHSVARNHCLMILRKPRLEELFAPEEENSDDTFMEKMPQMHLTLETDSIEEKLQALEHSLASLQEKQQRCIRMFYLEGLSYEQIAKQSNLSLPEVKSAIQNGKRNLKIQLSAKGITWLILAGTWIQQSA